MEGHARVVAEEGQRFSLGFVSAGDDGASERVLGGLLGGRDQPQERGLVGAVGGAIAGKALGGSAVTGAIAGAVLGGVIGATVNGRQYYRDTRGYCYYVDQYGQPHYDYSTRC